MSSPPGKPVTAQRKAAAARLSILSNVLLTVLKLVVGAVSGSVSILSESAHSATDLVASCIAFFSVRIADLPADEEHPYGHGKIESLSGLAEALLIFIAAALILYEAAHKLTAHAAPDHLLLGMGVMLLSVVTNAFVARYLFREARETDSLALKADAAHLSADVYTSLGVLGGLTLSYLTGWTWVDAAAAILVSAWIVRGACHLLGEAVAPLLDSRLSEAEVQIVRNVLDKEAWVLGYHKLRTRKSGSARYVDAHILMDDDMSLQEAHAHTEGVEDRIRTALPNTEITLHTEPYRAERMHQYEKHGGPRPEEHDPC